MVIASADDSDWQPPKPKDLPALREHLTDYLCSEPAFVLTAQNMRLGLGTLRPNADPDLAATMLLDDEYRRLSQARLFYVTPDITTLVQHAARSLKDHWDIQPQDLPALTGFMLFAKPMAEYVRDNGHTVRVVAVSWGSTELVGARDAGLWLTFWSVTPFDRIARLLRPYGASASSAMAAAKAQHAELTWDNEIYLPWGECDTSDIGARSRPEVRRVDPTKLAAATTTLDWLRITHAGWVFCQPNNFTDIAEQHESKTMRRRAERKGLTPAPVRVVSVSAKSRPSAPRAGEPSGRTVSVRFPVAPFIRRQPYGPGRSLRRMQLVAGHWRGPADAPVRIGKKVNLVDTPLDQE